ncbi:MAG TPA: MOSC domain-containing protein, partial [Propionibacteriaceae bacterium]|nr:MOSC domain-containing protein [Propionibacteriaceae bacterium]
RYRMLIEVEGGAAFEEDSWVGGTVRIGEVLVRVTHALERCVVINHHPRTGAKDWPGLKTLVTRGRDQLTLGVIAQVEQTGVIRVGDLVEPGSS